jgi:nitroreductase
MPYNINKISSIIYHRKSSKSYTEHQQIPEEDLLSFFEAARWAPSSGNRQPWRYLLFTETNIDQLSKMRSCLIDDNQIWANSAPVLILSCTQTINEAGKTNRMAMHDVGLANQNLLLQICSLGYNCRPMGGFDKEKAKSLFNIPESIQPVIVIAVGFPGKLSSQPEAIREEERKPRTRNEITTWVYQSQWGTQLPDNKYTY